MSENTTEKKLPEINVIDKDEFESQTSRVFELLWEVLSKSFGPYGSQTIIYKHPFSHVTKDGFTIAHSLSMNVAETYTREAIMNMALQICGRMNNAVGDGTTTAIVCTSSIYKSYLENREWLAESGVLPRDVLNSFNRIKDMIRTQLARKVRPISGKGISNDELKESIRQVVSISSNGDESVTYNLAELYGKLGYPAITCEKSKDGVGSVTLVQGFRLPMYITDKLYINNDEKTLKLHEADILVFSCKITEDIFEGLIRPIWEWLSRPCGRRLIVAAPSWDEILMDRKLGPELLREYEKTQSASLVVCAYKATNVYQRKAAEDFAMLCHTKIIDRAKVADILSNTVPGFNKGPDGRKPSIFDVINTRREYLYHVPFPAMVPDNHSYRPIVCTHTYEDPAEERRALANIAENSEGYIPGGEYDCPQYFDVGYVEEIEIGLSNTVAHKFYYDENMYKLHMQDATLNLETIEGKYKKLGTFNTELVKAQQRVFALRMQMANIEVGGDSELSIGMRKDVYDDAIRAAESAYKYGVINGCNVTTMEAAHDVACALERSNNPKNIQLTDNYELDMRILRIITEGLRSTYKTVLGNWINDIVIAYDVSKKTISSEMETIAANAYDMVLSIFNKYIRSDKVPNLNTLFGCSTGNRVNIEEDVLTTITQLIQSTLEYRCVGDEEVDITFFDILITHSVKNQVVFDLTTKEFSKNIINSFQTDDEILNAVIDLLGLLISGNQMVVTARQSFEV